MAATDPRVDAYIAKSADFARPILEHLRAVAHAADKDIEETIKWGMPCFTVDGGIVCNMAAFKQHCAFNLWHGKQVLGESADDAMGQFGRIQKKADLPPKKELVTLLKQAVRLRREGTAAPRKRAAKPEAPVPDDLAAALKLKKHAKARATFEGFPPGQRREYIEWITEAKREATREKRLATTLEWLAEGKQRNWKYM
ncbi:YdeI/OmpD-associated family protein [Oleiagrimonas soli]|uniref:Uncharacterized protein YdeI (YjbR/CyaY-like superfamily) n=1 Tax=Oleiagrimonas soli TaxID=1543381 RepID=A0A099CW68_9GAMM|nr:YdeI/OmpD-associated family protein [Oleiagrimonas soli]KGI77882.1 hypothetical protein LF63_0105620 [Oleiagrimonas soli]MBB6183758.1 uncharacterized protein YdeI (YjbR/CyaY-like superfamily) [Oleiagrimonas soli]